MNIIVCIKQVLTRDWPFQVDAQGTWVREQDVVYAGNYFMSPQDDLELAKQ